VIQLRLHEQAASVDLIGGRVTSYVVAGREVLAAGDPPSAYRSALLAPWPNRVAHGSWRWQEEELHLPLNEDPPGTAIHGLVAFEHFEVHEQSATSVRLHYELPASAGYPFPLRVEASYSLTRQGLACSLEAEATGESPTPVALGVHPYIDTRGPVDEVALVIPGQTVVEGDARWEERTRTSAGELDLDFRRARKIGLVELDTCWTDLLPDGDARTRCRVTLPGGDEVVVWGGSAARYVVAYTADTLVGPWRRTSLAVEPTTAPANALRSGTDLDVLAPGERLVLDWGLCPSWL
jgi:aldose 1-epimerase